MAKMQYFIYVLQCFMFYLTLIKKNNNDDALRLYYLGVTRIAFTAVCATGGRIKSWIKDARNSFNNLITNYHPEKNDKTYSNERVNRHAMEKPSPPL